MNDLPLWPKIACLDCVESLQEVIKFRKKLIRVHKYLSHELALRLIRTEKLKWMKKCQADVTESSHAKSANNVHPDVDEPSMKCLEKECDLVDSASQELVQEPMIEGNSSVVIETWLEEVELQPEEIELQPEQGSIILDQSFKESDVQLELGNSLDIVEFVDNAEVEDYLIEEVMPESEANVALPPKPSQVEEKRRRKKENPVPTPTVTYFSRVRFMSKTPLTDEEKRLEEVIMDMKLFDCRLCFVVTESLHGLNMHLKEVHRIERKRNSTKGYFICCHLRGPVGPHALYDHIRLHLDKDAFKCKECDFQTTASLYLKNHIAHYHTQTPPTHYCDVCGAGFHTNFHMLDHIRRHAPRTAQTCKYCNKGGHMNSSNNKLDSGYIFSSLTLVSL